MERKTPGVTRQKILGNLKIMYEYKRSLQEIAHSLK
jgi:hypothetical protein